VQRRWHEVLLTHLDETVGLQVPHPNLVELILGEVSFGLQSLYKRLVENLFPCRRLPAAYLLPL